MKQNSDLKTAYAIKASFYFFAFSFGSSLPYLAPFFKEHYGASDHQIGILLMIRPAIALALQPLWSLIVDTSGRRSLLAALLSLLAGLSFPFILLAHSYTMIIILLAVWAIFHGPLWSLGDSIAFDYLGHHRRLRLANFRIFGSLGWITAVLLVGKSIDSLGIQWLFPFYSISVILSGYFIFNIPSSTKTPFMTGKKAIKDLLKKQNIRLLIFVLLLAGIANQMAYSFLSLYGKSLGAKNVHVGIIWAIATTAELFTMFYFSKIAGRLGIKKILAIGLASMTIRWIPLTFLSTWWQLLPFQMFHALNFTFIYIGAITYFDMESPAEIRFTAQAFYTMFIVNASVMLGSFAGGEISQYWGYRNIYLFSGIAGFVATIILILFIQEPGQKVKAKP